MKVICAWCRKDIRSSGEAAGPDAPVSHGICRECSDNLFFQVGVDLRRYLDSLPAPVVAVDPNGVVTTANAKARQMLGKDSPEIDGRRGGQVFECAYARLPEGCGNTVHCSGCTIRRAVMQTWETGGSMLRAPASLIQDGPEGEQRVRLLISTQKFGSVVLLRIDEMSKEAAGLSRPGKECA
jgi:PAS domain-containing protein